VVEPLPAVPPLPLPSSHLHLQAELRQFHEKYRTRVGPLVGTTTRRALRNAHSCVSADSTTRK